MEIPSPKQWERIYELVSIFDEESPTALQTKLNELENGQEEDLVVSYVRLKYKLPPAPIRLVPGDRVAGRYLLREQLGEGGMGVVFRARQERTGRDVALKMIHPSQASAGLGARFAEEIEMLGQLDHPNIVRVFDADIHQDSRGGPEIPFFAMELLDGEPMQRRFAKSRPSTSQALELVHQVCLAVHHAHDRNIVHRDLKPGNILIRTDGTPVVLDFGLAQARGRALRALDSSVGSLLPASGTPHYMAPERFLSARVDFELGQRGDIYALGVILFELLAGCHPHGIDKKASIADVRSAIVDRIPARLKTVCDAEDDLDEMLALALQRHPEERYSSAAAFARALERAILARKPKPVQPPVWRPEANALVPSTQWKLLRRLGQGGVGEVWLVEHTELATHRVMKFCVDEDKVRSLRRELSLFRILEERLRGHPHFVRLYEASLDEAPRYLLLEYVEALDLAQWFASRNGAVPRETLIEIVAQAAEALQAAHDAGVLHRDVKPGNLLIADQATPPHCHVYLTDFGIGQMAVAPEGGWMRPGFTRTLLGPEAASFSGTQLYMAPEVQAHHHATPRSDLYALGIVLFQCLMRDFEMPLLADWERRIDDPLLLEDLRGSLAGDPADRFGSTGEFARRLRALPARRAEATLREEEARHRERAAYRRGAWRTAALASGILIIVTALALFAFAKSRAERAAAKRAGLARAAAAMGEARALITSTAAGHKQRALAALRDAAPDAPDMALAMRNLATQLLIDKDYELDWRRELIGIQTTVVPACSTKGMIVLAMNDGRCGMLLANAAGEPIDFLPPAPGISSIRSMTIDASGRRLALADEQGHCGWWELENNIFHPLPDLASALAFDEKGEHLAVGLRADANDIGEIVMWRCSDGQEVKRLVSRRFPFSREAGAIAFRQIGDLELLAVSSRASQHAFVWNATSGSLHAQTFQPGLVNGVVWVGDDKIPLLATACQDGQTRLFRVEPDREDRFLDRPVALWSGHQWPVEQVLADSTGLIATRDSAGEVIIRSASTGEINCRFPINRELSAIAWAEGGRLLLQTKSGIEVWRPREIKSRLQVAAPIIGRGDLDFSPKSEVVAVATGADVRLYGMETGRLLATTQMPMASAVRFGADDSLIVSVRDGVQRWELQRQDNEWEFRPTKPLPTEGRTGLLDVSRLSPHAAVGAAEQVFLIDFSQEAKSVSINVGSRVEGLALAPDGNSFAAYSRNKGTVLGSTPTGALQETNLAGPWLQFAEGTWRGSSRPFAAAQGMEIRIESESVWVLRAGESELIRSADASPRVMERVAMSQDGLRFGILWRDGVVDLWSVPTLYSELSKLGLAWGQRLLPAVIQREPSAVRFAPGPPKR